MTLFELIILIKKEFPLAKEEKILMYINDLEFKLYNEILKPVGIRGNQKLELKKDNSKPLSLGDDFKSLYVFYVFAMLSLENGDTENYNSYSSLFNQKFSEAAIIIRRDNKPAISPQITGRGIN